MLLHVVAQSALQRRYSGSGRNVRGALADAGFDKRLIERNVEKLDASRRAASRRPGPRPNGPTTTGRTPTTPPSSTRRRPSCDAPWKPAAGGASGTSGATPAPSRGSPPRTPTRSSPWTPIRWPFERLYQRLRATRESDRILPLVVNLADASPNQGWRGLERKDLAARGRPDLTLCLALVHHVVITANIPLADFVDWLRSLGSAVVIEFVGRDDEMVKTLLANREDQYDDYDPANFRNLLSGSFDIIEEGSLKEGSRTMFFAEPRSVPR